MEGRIELEYFNPENKTIQSVQLVKLVREFNRYSNMSWELKLRKIVKCFKGRSGAWGEMHNMKWWSFAEFEKIFRGKYRPSKNRRIFRE